QRLDFFLAQGGIGNFKSNPQVEPIDFRLSHLEAHPACDVVRGKRSQLPVQVHQDVGRQGLEPSRKLLREVAAGTQTKLAAEGIPLQLQRFEQADDLVEVGAVVNDYRRITPAAFGAVAAINP